MDDDAPPPLDDELEGLLTAERRRPDTLDAALDDRMLARIRAEVGLSATTAAPRRASWRDVAIAAVGALAGAGLHATLRPSPPPQRIVVERVVERRVEVPVTQHVFVSLDAAAPADATRDATALRPRPATLPSTDDDDSALVERARVALLRARPADALVGAAEHARRFPRGQFAEEREAIAVQALAALGRSAEARSRAAAFHRRFPASPLGASVDAATR